MATATQRMSRSEQVDRRKAIAAAVTDVASLGRVAAKFCVSLETVRNSCRVYAPEKLGNRYGAAQPSPRSPRRRKAPAA